MPITDAERRLFDRLADEVRDALPALARTALDEITMVVQDEPSEEMMRAEGLEHPDELCGYFVGTPKTFESVETPFRLPNRIFLFREGHFAEACDEEGAVDPEELRRQIRMTILHEVGHYLGLDEDELEALGYG